METESIVWMQMDGKNVHLQYIERKNLVDLMTATIQT